MQKRKQQKPFLQYLKDDNKSTLDTIEILRRLNQATNALKDAEYERLHGPRTFMQKFWRALWRELTYVGIWVRKTLLIVAFNAIAIFLFFWLLSLL
jgi:hypothetical protein